METLWFAIIAGMLAAYVVFDGFDLGAGCIHLFIAKTDEERRTILNTIGPVWDGNEVWLLAAGGSLYFAFPLLYASSFSGFYLPLMIVLWLLMLRAAGIELRHQIHHPLWKSFWDVSFSVSSILLAVFFGAALGNVVRGVPLNQEGYFFEPLWTTFTVVPEAGILDWFTIILGLVALSTLTSHGANYIALKTTGSLQRRARSISGISWLATMLLSVIAFVSTLSVRPEILENFSKEPWGNLLPAGGIAGLILMLVGRLRENDRLAFTASTIFIGSMLAATAFGLYPNLLAASTNPSWSITVFNAAASEYGLRIGLVWWSIGMVLAASYFIFVYRKFRGKTMVPGEGEGY